MAIRRHPATTFDVEQVHAALGPGAMWVDTAGGRLAILAVPVETVASTSIAELRAVLGPRRTLDLPFAFHGGLVGTLSYEGSGSFARVEEFAVFDHRDRVLWLVGAERWCDAVEAGLHRPVPPLRLGPGLLPPHRYARADAQYLADIARCQAHIAAGDSYEICLTNQAIVDARPDPALLFRILRRLNPAPYAALLPGPDVAVVSSSPELFLAIDREGNVTTKPIKGTAPRGATAAEDEALAHELRTSEKTRAENVMIVDLLRNDLGRVCVTGSVAVPDLMVVETYATVHQLVSRITGRLRSGLDAFDCVEAAFPGGSMTGAPKKKTMELLAAIEGAPRGVYSGALGFFSTSGAAELAIVIRTAVIGDRTTIGVGGAITALSDPEAELAEAKLKAEGVLCGVGLALATPTSTADERRPAHGSPVGQT